MPLSRLPPLIRRSTCPLFYQSRQTRATLILGWEIVLSKQAFRATPCFRTMDLPASIAIVWVTAEETAPFQIHWLLKEPWQMDKSMHVCVKQTRSQYRPLIPYVNLPWKQSQLLTGLTYLASALDVTSGIKKIYLRFLRHFIEEKLIVALTFSRAKAWQLSTLYSIRKSCIYSPNSNLHHYCKRRLNRCHKHLTLFSKKKKNFSSNVF